ncbi:MAG: 30S ribosome-binding factor RbfA [Erysipelotrichaceae bacterium]|jgi:ribosome-binding factor A
MSLKKERLQSEILRYLTIIIRDDVKDSGIGYVTITDVILNNDSSIAKVYVTFLDKYQKDDYRLAALNKAKGLIRSKLAKKLKIRKCPEIIFVLDTSLKNANRIDEIINQLNKKEEM